MLSSRILHHRWGQHISGYEDRICGKRFNSWNILNIFHGHSRSVPPPMFLSLEDGVYLSPLLHGLTGHCAVTVVWMAEPCFTSHKELYETISCFCSILYYTPTSLLDLIAFYRWSSWIFKKDNSSRKKKHFYKQNKKYARTEPSSSFLRLIRNTGAC